MKRQLERVSTEREANEAISIAALDELTRQVDSEDIDVYLHANDDALMELRIARVQVAFELAQEDSIERWRQ